MAVLAPDRLSEAMLWVGFTRYVRQDAAGALDAWQSGLTSPSEPSIEAQLHYWRGKALPAGSSESVGALNAAVALAPESYHGLRAQDLLAGSTMSVAAAPGDWRVPSAAELAERDAWLTTQGTSLAQVRAEADDLAGLQRAQALFDIGLPTEASWEVDGVTAAYAATKDVAHLSAVADWLAERDLPQLTLRVGKLERDLVGLAALPRAVQKQVYPDGYSDLVVEQTARFGVDPLLMLAMMRQESSFEPTAQSGAQAMGLTQIVPSTARSIAARLDYPDFTPRDLFKPSLSLEFGTWYMSTLLKEFANRPFPPWPRTTPAAAMWRAGSTATATTLTC